jgi:hypothetical protein
LVVSQRFGIGRLGRLRLDWEPPRLRLDWNGALATVVTAARTRLAAEVQREQTEEERDGNAIHPRDWRPELLGR